MSRHRVFVGLVLFFTVSRWLSGGELKADFINGGFETGDFTGWSTIGNVTIQTAAYGAGPTEGTYQALLQTQGGVSEAALEAFLDLRPGTLSFFAPPGQQIQAGSAIMQTNADNGVIGFNWDFLTNQDALPNRSSDIILLSISTGGETGSVSTISGASLSLVSSATPYSFETGFHFSSVTFFTNPPLPHGVGFIVLTTDATHSSGLLIDDVRIIPEPSSLVLGGMATLVGLACGWLKRRARRLIE